MGSLPASPELRYITTDELLKHSTSDDMWVAIHGEVYNVTAWAKDHPGGESPLINLAGQDVTDAFVALHPGSAYHLLDRFHVAHLSDYRISDVSRDFRRLNADFSKMGLYNNKGQGVAPRIVLCAIIFIAAVHGIVASTSLFAHLASGGLIGLLWIVAGFVGHDWGHYNLNSSNRLTQILTGNCLTGLSIGWWKWTHNAHHVGCNSLEYDPDIQHVPLFAVSNKLFTSLDSHFFERKMAFSTVARFLVSYQHWTFYPVMPFARLNLLAQSIVYVIRNKKLMHRRQEIAGVVAFWVWYVFLVSCLPDWRERVMFVAANFAVVSIQHVQFCLNHFSGGVYVGRPRGDDWLEKQTAGTIDIDCSPWMDWFHGGLQFQVEHHLFPRLPRCHLRRISPMVRELCKKHGVAYASASFWEANRKTLRVLRAAAIEARDMANPMTKNLVWEAVNTHG